MGTSKPVTVPVGVTVGFSDGTEVTNCEELQLELEGGGEFVLVGKTIVAVDTDVHVTHSRIEQLDRLCTPDEAPYNRVRVLADRTFDPIVKFDRERFFEQNICLRLGIGSGIAAAPRKRGQCVRGGLFFLRDLLGREDVQASIDDQVS